MMSWEKPYRTFILNPANVHQSLLISSNSNEANLDILSDASEDYLLDRKRAGQILYQVTHVTEKYIYLLLL